MALLPTPQLTTDILDSINSSDTTLSTSITYYYTILNPHPELRAAVFSGVLVISISAFRAYRRVADKNAEAALLPLAQRPNQAQITRSNQAPKERKVLTKEELKLYSVSEFTEKMTRAKIKDDRNTTPKNEKPMDNEYYTKKPENDVNKDSEGKTKTIESNSNILSNAFSQEKSDTLDPTSINKSQDESIQNHSKLNDINGSDCQICFEIINIGDKIREIPCLHRFHKECLDNWLTSRSGSCPNCRYDLRPLKERSLENVPEIDISIRNPNLSSHTGANIIPASQYQNNVIFEINDTSNANKKSMARQVLEEMFKSAFSARRSRRGIGTSSRLISNTHNMRSQS
ncbi:Receptor homology region, transmembrane domain- and RING domain-containing protein 3 [Smittium culicis]|uniref:RING-type E3 ubiquitin transferase n=1 Tax=Smittium culicis TaxID=133412 RepID=A0A1R1XSK7_9FUNG|nr:Receptor homology region, transmembrane domain- and RING domain-containing protein 3 [Smittium culicis]